MQEKSETPQTVSALAFALLLALATPALAEDSLTVCKSVTTTQTTGGGVHDFSIRCQGKSGAAMLVMTHEQAQGLRTFLNDLQSPAPEAPRKDECVVQVTKITESMTFSDTKSIGWKHALCFDNIEHATIIVFPKPLGGIVIRDNTIIATGATK